MKKIKYIKILAVTVTNCPYSMEIFKRKYVAVASITCSRCAYFKHDDEYNKEIICMYNAGQAVEKDIEGYNEYIARKK